MTEPKLDQARERHWICARRLREQRTTLGLTQREVAARLDDLGSQITNRALSAMENGRGLDLGLLPDLAGVLDCTVTFLLGLTTDPHAWRPDHAAPVRSSPVAEATRSVSVPVWQTAGVLGPELPAGFAAPCRLRRRNGSRLTRADGL